MAENPLKRHRAERTRHTIWGLRLQAQTHLGLSPQIMQNTTLNEKFNVNVVRNLGANEKPVAKYFVIGRGGHVFKRSPSGVDIPTSIDHDPTDAALYEHIPFVLRREGNDLPPERRNQYRLRVQRQFNGVNYIAYYAKVFNIDSQIEVMLEKLQNGNLNKTQYVATENNLTPRKPEITPNRAVKTSDTRISVSTGAEIVFTQEDIEEVLDACAVIYGSYEESIISEIGIVSGVDDVNYQSSDGERIVEIKGATVCTFISTLYSLMHHNEGFRERLTAGDGIPLLTNSPVVATVGAGVGG